MQVLCDISPEKAAKLNEERDKLEQYDTTIFEGLVERFEEPISTNRWDSPLITVQSEGTLPCKNICDAVLKRKPPTPNMYTQCLSSQNKLYVANYVIISTKRFGSCVHTYIIVYNHYWSVHILNIVFFQQPLSSTNFLYELDKRTQEIVNYIMSNQKLSVIGDSISITGATDTVSFNTGYK
ncbi:hypothetical protein SNE40_007301 [Patella caerulea]|uniref:Protein KTI12 homolog n=1 Tax=Patella caerulea TaxID=87958 RepID=A0AAN8PTI8_PATCE